MSRRIYSRLVALMLVAAALAALAGAVGIAQAGGDRPVLIEQDDDAGADAAADTPGPTKFTPDLVQDTSEIAIDQIHGSPIPDGRFAQATVLAEGSDVDYVDIAGECAKAQLAAGSEQADGGLCTVFHSREAYESEDLTISARDMGVQDVNLMGNLCYVALAWVMRDGEVEASDLRRGSITWEDRDCPPLPEADA